MPLIHLESSHYLFSFILFLCALIIWFLLDKIKKDKNESVKNLNNIKGKSEQLELLEALQNRLESDSYTKEDINTIIGMIRFLCVNYEQNIMPNKENNGK